MPHHASSQIEPYAESLRGGVPPFNGGAGGRYPQIRVLPPPGTSQLTSIYRLPLRLLKYHPDRQKLPLIQRLDPTRSAPPNIEFRPTLIYEYTIEYRDLATATI
jgi:hypothetical protein